MGHSLRQVARLYLVTPILLESDCDGCYSYSLIYSITLSQFKCYSVMISQIFLGPYPLYQFLSLYTVGRTPWTGDQPVARLLPTHRTSQTQNKRTHTSMPLVVFELMIPVMEREKTIHATDRAATMFST
jgi:hypothetical protein